MRYLILVRHGESQLNAQHRLQPVFCGQIETQLTASGCAQAKAVGKYLAAHPEIRLQRAISSRLQRAVDTLSLILAELPPTVERLAPAAELNERSLGEFEGRSEEDVFRQWPQFRDDEQLRNFRNCFVQKAPGGENLTDVTGRAWPLVERLLADDGDLLVVAHYNPIRCLLGKALDLAPEEILRLKPRNASPLVLRCDLPLGVDRRFELVEEKFFCEHE